MNYTPQTTPGQKGSGEDKKPSRSSSDGLRGTTFDEGESLLMPRQDGPSSSRPGTSNDNYDSRDSEDDDDDSNSSSADEDDGLMPGFLMCNEEGERRLECLTLPEMVVFDPSELVAWAKTMGFAVLPGGRIVDPQRQRHELKGAPEDERMRSCETIIKLTSLTQQQATVAYTSLSLSHFAKLAESISQEFPTVFQLFGKFAKLAPSVMHQRELDRTGADAKLGHYDKKIERGPRGKTDVTDQIPQLPQTPLAPGQLMRALPVPEGTTGVFEVGPDETVDVCSSGFVTCTGVVLVARHPNGRRTVGITHPNQDCVDRVRSSFTGFVQDVLGPNGGALEVYLVGGGNGHLAGLAMAHSLLELFAELKSTQNLDVRLAGQSLFDRGGAYTFRSTDSGLSMHRANPRENKALEKKQEALVDFMPAFALLRDMASIYCLSPSELLNICTRGKPHPMLAALQHQEQ